jgi:hypothetical protein
MRRELIWEALSPAEEKDSAFVSACNFPMKPSVSQDRLRTNMNLEKWEEKGRRLCVKCVFWNNAPVVVVGLAVAMVACPDDVRIL